jgi:hypothetical protein
MNKNFSCYITYKNRDLFIRANVWDRPGDFYNPPELEIAILECTYLNKDFLPILERYSIHFNQEIFDKLEIMIWDKYLEII